MESSISLSGRGLRSRVVLVGVVDEHDIFRRGIVACLGNDAGLQVVYDARTGPVPVPVDVTVASPRAVTRLTGPSPVLVCSDARALPYRPRDGGGRPTGRGGHRSGTAVTAPPSPRFAAQPAVGPYGHLAPLYDELLGDRFFGELRRTFEWLVGRYGLRFDSVADVGCGTGSFVRYLRSIGVHTVWGIDCSREMLRVAVAKNAGTGARFLHQDMRKLRLPCRVDLITSHFDALNYLLDPADLRAAFRGFGDNLDREGHAIFDLVTERLTWPGAGPAVERARHPGVTVTRVTRRDPSRRLQTARVEIHRGDSITVETHVQRAYSIQEVWSALRGSGMRLWAVHDFHHLARPPGLAERAVYVARRAQP